MAAGRITFKPELCKKTLILIIGVYRADDMLAILFPHMYEDVEEHLLEDYSEGNVVGDAEHLPRDDFIDLRAPVPGPSRIDQR